MTRPDDPPRTTTRRPVKLLGRPPLDDPAALDDWIEGFVAELGSLADRDAGDER